jgi:hypothetical protein
VGHLHRQFTFESMKRELERDQSSDVLRAKALMFLQAWQTAHTMLEQQMAEQLGMRPQS